ncbi:MULTISPECIES: uracil-DNA glycosylase family protein [Mesorhizobium]|uniref:Uracil-DNA glycosylase family protein n=1 Tax=Mesorhizobium denitrificans TaxID=2294114 RepID=A0A371X6N6_9HYPH|nr:MULTISPECIES: uracil-DNA glycosylase family protein [Mesorhizobium]RFC64888.1 uracil-DNA glycosylase family protein [Mesorhizobium denitrificans]
MNREIQLQELSARARNCRICIEHPIGNPLPHEPRPVFTVSTKAKILIAGQAPGTKVYESGVPFQDRSGDTLRKWLGVDRPTFYDPTKFAILPMGFCFPGQDKKGSDLPPRPECAPAWRQQFLDLMPELKLLLVIGQYAQAWHLGPNRRKTLTETVADWRNIYDQTENPKILAMPHPSWRSGIWIKKNPWFETDLLPMLARTVRNLIE